MIYIYSMGLRPDSDSSNTGVQPPPPPSSDTDEWNQYRLISPLTQTGAQISSNISAQWEITGAEFTIKEMISAVMSARYLH